MSEGDSPGKTQHLRQAAQNEEVSLALQGSHNDWAITAIFYAAVHYVDMYFAAQSPPRTFKSHTARKQPIMGELTPVWRDYQDLLDDSWNARYHCAQYTSSEVRERREKLERIKDHIRSKGVDIP